MADVCACCGEVIYGYFNVEIDAKTYKLCEKCNSKMKSGKISVGDLSSSAVKGIEEAIKSEEERVVRKLSAQKDDPLYDDIHQIAGDLRFLKNLVIIGLILSILLSIISVMLPFISL